MLDVGVIGAGHGVVVGGSGVEAIKLGSLSVEAESPAATTPHVTRRRTNSTIRRPRHLDSPPPSPGAGSVSLDSPAAIPSAKLSGASAGPTVARKVAAPSLPPLRVVLGSSTSAPVGGVPTAPSRSLSLHLSVKPKTVASFPHTNSYVPKTTGNAHPRDLVPGDVPFPPSHLAHHVRPEDREDRLLMATCAVLHAHQNRALCPKEVAEVMFEKGWLHNAGTTPFAHVSTCIRSHLRRCAIAVPPYAPLLTSFELVGALTAVEIRAVGLRSEERPAVKRGTLWYLDEKILGKGVGADDPFARCRAEAGVSKSNPESQAKLARPSTAPGVIRNAGTPRAGQPRVRLPVPVAVSGVTALSMLLDEDDDDVTGMGRGKRKRRASSAAMSGIGLGSPLVPGSITSSPITIPISTPQWNTSSHRRHSSFISASAPTKSNIIPRLRLRLTNLEEVDSMDDSADDTDPNSRSFKKKARRATSEGLLTLAMADESSSSEEEEDEVDAAIARRSAFSSASSSALLAQSLLAVSTATSPALLQRATTHSAISPGSLQLASGPFHRPTPHHLSASAPNIFAGFSSAQSPDPMEVDYERQASEDVADRDTPPLDEEDFHEVMLRGEDFDFEWGSETYTTGLPLPPFSQRARNKTSREFSVPHYEQVAVVVPPVVAPVEDDDDDDEGEGKDDDDSSTPATTPRSPAVEEFDLNAEVKGGMEETLCEAFEEDIDLEDNKPTLSVIVDRVSSTDSLATLCSDTEESKEHLAAHDPSSLTQLLAEDSSLPLPLPSPLSLELPPMLPHGSTYAVDYDFVGDEDDDDDRSAYRNRDYMGESADDEDEDDDEISVKLEDEGSIESSSRQSSTFPAPQLGSFASRLTAGLPRDGSASSGSSDGDSFDPTNMMVSNSILASGRSIPHVAPSPPETMEWGMSLDMDELDLEIGHTSLLGPESVGLEELDLVWGGPAEQAEDETVEEWKFRTLGRAKAKEAKQAEAGSACRTFLTRSPVDGFSTPLALPFSRATTPPLATTPTTATPSPVPALVSICSPVTASPTVVVYPKIPLSPTVTATIVQRGIAVYATTVVDSETGTTLPLLRRIDTDYTNGTALLLPSSSSKVEASLILAQLADTFRVTAGGPGVEGIWIPLDAARELAAKDAALASFCVFLEDNLGSRFPEPIPTMRSALRADIVSSTLALGSPAFMDTEPSVSPSASVTPASPARKSTAAVQSTPSPHSTRGARRNSVAVAAAEHTSTRKPRRSIARPRDE